MGATELIRWRVFSNRYARAERILQDKVQEFFEISGEKIEIRFKRFNLKADGSETVNKETAFSLETYGIPVLEIYEICGEGRATKCLNNLISADLPICDNDPKIVIKKFIEIFDEATKIIKKELHIR